MSKIARKKLFADESRIWNFEEPAAGSPSSMSTNIHKVNFIRLYVDRPTRKIYIKHKRIFKKFNQHRNK